MGIAAPTASGALRTAARALAPLGVFVLSLGILWAAQTLRLAHGQDLFPFPALGLALILAGEFALWRWHDRGFAGWRRFLRTRGLGGLERALSVVPPVLRALAWIGLFWALVEDPARIGDPDEFRSWQGQARFAWSWLVLVAEVAPPLTFVAGTAWLALYLAVVGRLRVLRGAVFFLAGPAVLWLLINAWYHQWFPTDDFDRLTAQKGVHLLLDTRTIEDEHLRVAWNYPRALRVDEDAGKAYVSLGATLGTSGTEGPNLWQIDLDTAAYRTLESRQVRVLALVPDSPYLYAFPWYTHEILKIDRRDFRIVKRIGYQDVFPAYSSQPSDLVLRPPWVYVSMCYLPVVLRLDLRTDTVPDALDLRDDGLLENGSLCCHFADDPDAGRIYFTASRNDRNLVGVIDTGRFAVEKTATVPIDPRWIVRSTDERQPGVFVIDDFNGHMIDLSEDDLTQHAECDTSPRSILDADPVGQRLLQVDHLEGTLVIRTFDCGIERSVYVGSKPYGVFAGKRGIYVVSSAGLVLVERAPPMP